jgi:predicted RNA binding protein YcfA (HicA-like mRNA interferase family)
MPTAAEFLRFLTKRGDRRIRQSSSHLILEHATRQMLVVQGHRGDIPKGLFHKILKDAGFSLEEFRMK